MAMRRVVRPILAAAAMAASAAWAAPVQAPRFVAFDTLQHGMWQLKEVGAATRAVCVRDPASLFQLRSRGAGCSRFVVENGATSATVHYTCPGRGHGRTTISVETPRLLHIESEGIESGAPFSIELEGRRTGDCPAA